MPHLLQKILSGNFYHWHPKESQDMHNIHMSPIISLSVFCSYFMKIWLQAKTSSALIWNISLLISIFVTNSNRKRMIPFRGYHPFLSLWTCLYIELEGEANSCIQSPLVIHLRSEVLGECSINVTAFTHLEAST